MAIPHRTQRELIKRRLIGLVGKPRLEEIRKYLQNDGKDEI